MKYVDKIIFRDKETYNKLYQGSELLFKVDKEVELDYLTFTALEPSTILYEPSTVTTAQYSYDKVNWKTADNVTINLNTGDKVYFKGEITGTQKSISEARIRMTGKVSASGSIMSLQSGNPQDKSLKYDYEFERLFYNCSSLVTAPELPATRLTDYCYFYLFYGCSSLTKAPELPSTRLSYACYAYLFFKCGKLNYIKCNAREYQEDNFYMWVNSVANTGDFYCYNSSIFPIESSGIHNGWTIHSEIEPTNVYDVIYVSGRYEFKIPKGNGTYYAIGFNNDCEADIITDKDFTSLNQTIIASTLVDDDSEWELFFNDKNLYFDMGKKFGWRLSWEFGILKKDTKYTIGGSNGNYLGTDRALYFNGSKKVYSNNLSFHDSSEIVKIGENVTSVYVGNIKIYRNTGLLYHIVPVMYNGIVEFYDKVNKRFMEITATPPSQYVRTRATGEQIVI